MQPVASYFPTNYVTCFHTKGSFLYIPGFLGLYVKLRGVFAGLFVALAQFDCATTRGDIVSALVMWWLRRPLTSQKRWGPPCRASVRGLGVGVREAGTCLGDHVRICRPRPYNPETMDMLKLNKLAVPSLRRDYVDLFACCGT